jgi:DNA helicase II / ATP-dependent DNA helicase PcrA
VNRDDLSCGQREVVEATENVVVVEGGAGSGKTTAALWAAREHLAREGSTPAERVLFVTFSRTAVGLIARRSRRVLADFGGQIEIQTFHSLSYRLLRAFGRYNGMGRETPSIESEARAKLLGRDGTRLSYDDLLPIALNLLNNSRIAALAGARWSLVVCDEFQDTDSNQWDLLLRLSQSGRLLLFADRHQMIHSWRPTVDAARLERAISQADRVIQLEDASYRDPSGVIPAMAGRVREREFQHDAVKVAIESGRLKIISCLGEDVPDVVHKEAVELRRSGCRSIGVFETTNVGTAELGAELTDRGVNHTLIGIPEAQGEGLLAQACLFAYGLGEMDFAEAQIQLAIFLTAGVRSKDPPQLAFQMRDNAIVSAPLQSRFDELAANLIATTDPQQLIDVVTGAWEALGITAATMAWRNAARSFAALTRRLVREQPDPIHLAEAVLNGAKDLQTEALITADSPDGGSIQLMNFHQTKGREADAVILVYREGGFVTSWKDREPFEEKSRVLYVGLTRARERVTILLPPDPHELVAPFQYV